MSDVVAAALITVGGMLGVSITTGIVQWRVMRAVQRGESDRTRTRIADESRARASERRTERLLDLLSTLLAVGDPHVDPYDLPTVLKTANQIQLLLDVEEPSEMRLNDCLNRFVLAAFSYYHGRDDGSGVSKLHTKVLYAAREMFGKQLVQGNGVLIGPEEER